MAFKVLKVEVNSTFKTLNTLGKSDLINDGKNGKIS